MANTSLRQIIVTSYFIMPILVLIVLVSNLAGGNTMPLVPVAWMAGALFVLSILAHILYINENWRSIITYCYMAILLVGVTILVHLTGGITSPFIWLYLVYITLAGMFLEVPQGVFTTALALLIMTALVLMEDRTLTPAYLPFDKTSALNPYGKPGFLVPMLMAYDLIFGLVGLIIALAPKRVKEAAEPVVREVVKEKVLLPPLKPEDRKLIEDELNKTEETIKSMDDDFILVRDRLKRSQNVISKSDDDLVHSREKLKKGLDALAVVEKNISSELDEEALKETKAELKAIISELSGSRDTLTLMMSKLLTLKEEILKGENAVTSVTADIRELGNEILAGKEAIAVTNKEIDDRERQIEALRAETDDLKFGVSTAESTAVVHKTEASKAKEEMETKEAEIINLMEELEKIREEVSKKEEEISNKDLEIETLKGELEAKPEVEMVPAEELTQAKNKLTEKETEIVSLQKQLELKEKEIESLKKVREEAQAVAAAAPSEEVETLREELKSSQDAFKFLNEEVKVIEEDIKHTREKLAQKEHEVESLAAKLTELESLKADAAELQRTKEVLAEKESAIATLHDKLEELQQLKADEAELQKTKDELSARESEITSLKKELENLQSVKDAVTELEATKAALEEKDRLVKSLKEAAAKGQELSETVERIKGIEEVIGLIAKEKDFEKVLSVVLEKSAEFLGMDSCHVCLWEDEKGACIVKAIDNMPLSFLGHSFAHGNSFIVKILQEKDMLLASDYTSYLDEVPELWEEKYQVAIGFPVISEDRLLGAIEFLSKNPEKKLDEREMRFTEELGKLLLPVFEKYRLSEDLKVYHHELVKVQESLLAIQKESSARAKAELEEEFTPAARSASSEEEIK